MLPGPSELLIIFGVALLLFGPSKLPQLGGAIGESIRNFKKGMKLNEGQDTQQPNSQANPQLAKEASSQNLADPSVHTPPQASQVPPPKFDA